MKSLPLRAAVGSGVPPWESGWRASRKAARSTGFGTGSQGGNVPLNKLYVTLLNAIGATNAGMPITTFGVCDTNDIAAGITKPGELDTIKA